MSEEFDEQELMSFYDGELPDDRVAVWEERLRSDEEAANALARLRSIGDAVRQLSDERGAGGAQIADAVMAAIARDGQGAAARPASAWRRLAPVAAATLALAAAVTLVLRGAGERAGAVGTPAESAVSANGPAPARSEAVEPSEAAEPEMVPAVAIESVDFGAHDGTIFMVQSGDTDTPVVWLVDEPSRPHDRIEPL